MRIGRWVVKGLGLTDDAIRGVIALILVSGWVVSAVLGRDVPEQLISVTLLYVGYYVARRVNGDGVKLRKDN